MWESIHRVLNRKPGALLQPSEDQIEQFLQGLTAITPSDFLMQMPPYALNWVRIRRVSGEVVQDKALASLAEIALNKLTVMDRGVVTDDMDLTIIQHPTAQVVDGARTARHCAPPWAGLLSLSSRLCAS